jgi:pimeloyl-ACP methyl ester carboxylesterase
MTTVESILILNGAGLQADVWDDARAALPAAFVSAVAARPTRDRARLADYAQSALDSAPDGPFTVVAHSAGGLVAAQLAAQAPDRVTAILGVSAVYPRPGRSFLSSMPIPRRWLLGAALRLAGTRPPESAIRSGLASDLSEAEADRVVRDFTPESAALFRDRVTRGSWTGRTGYVHTEDDRELSLALQRRFAENLGSDWTTHLSTGHLPMLARPDELATAISAFVSDRVTVTSPSPR